MLPQIATLIGFDLGSHIIDKTVFKEGAELGIPIVICACEDLPCEVGVASPSAAVKGAARSGKVETRGFRIVNADAAADIWLESSKGEFHDKVTHKRTRINEAGSGAVSHYRTIYCQSGVGAASKAVVKEIPFNGRTKYAGAENVAAFDAAKKTDIIFRTNGKSISKLIRKHSVSPPVLIDIRSHVDGTVKTSAINWRRHRGDILRVGNDGFAGAHSNGDKSKQSEC